jgi:hypothetical protein
MTTRLRAIATALLLLASTPALPGADTPEARRGAAEALVRSMDELMGADRMLTTMRATMEAPLLEGIRGNQRLTPAQQQRAADVLVDVMVATTRELLQDVMPLVQAAMTDVYVTRFSLAELEQLQAFYASSAGRKSVTVMVDDLPQLMQPMLARMQERTPELQRRLEGAVRQLRAEGIELGPPPANAGD